MTSRASFLATDKDYHLIALVNELAVRQFTCSHAGMPT